MSATLIPDRREPGTPAPQATVTGPIVVASDGSAAAEAAFRFARTLHARTGRDVRVVSVVEPVASIAPAPLILANPEDGSSVARRHAVVRDQVERWFGSTNVPLTIQVGWPPELLVDAARSCEASIFVAGLVHHNALARMARVETPIAVLRGAGVPVLAVPESLGRLPERVVIAVDLSDTSVNAAGLAAPLLASARYVHLVHVQDLAPVLADPVMLPPDRTELVQEAFARIRRRLDLPAETRVQEHILKGTPAADISDFAAHIGADLVVLGHEHRGLWGRVLHSSVAERVYRLVSCAVFIVPQAWRESVPRARGIGVRTDVFRHRETWADELRAFTTRNEGRRLNLEIMTPELGAQAAAVNFPLLGVDFDPAARSVDIVLGDERRGARHLAHTIRDVSAIELSRFESGADWSLRIGHPGGQTLLTFAR